VDRMLSDSGFGVPGSGFRGSGNGFRGSGSGFRHPRSRFRVPASCVLIALCVVIGACSAGSADSPTADAPVVKLLREPIEVSAFTVTDVNGRVITSADLRGKVVIVNFWATWCPPCRAEIPDLIALQNKYRDQLVVLGISEDEGPIEAVHAFAAQYQMNYPIVMTTPELRKIFRGVVALPTTFVIDREGRIAKKHVGLLNAAVTELETQVLAGMNVNARIERVEDADRVRLENAAQATEIPGVDLTKLTPARRTEAIKAMNKDDCTCGCVLTLAECRINDPECAISLPLAQALAKKFADN
jgi:thiol-disulfide isomerase/thioredoxin